MSGCGGREVWERGWPQERMEGCTGERGRLREMLDSRVGSRAGRSVRWMVRCGDARARARLWGGLECGGSVEWI